MKIHKIIISLALTVLSSTTIAEVKIDITHSNGKVCTITTDDPNGVQLIQSGPNAGHLGSTTGGATPFSGDCIAVAPPPPPPPPGDCSASPPAMPSRVFNLTVTYPISGPDFTRYTNMRDYMDMIGVIPPPTGSGYPTFAPFPGNGRNSTLIFSMQTNYYIALKFTVPTDFPSTSIFELQFVQTGFLPQNTVSSMSISECEGDFKASLPAVCKTQWDGNDGGVVQFAAPDYDDPWNTVCKLTRGKTYYLNFVGATLTSPSTPTCQTGSCNIGISAKGYGP